MREETQQKLYAAYQGPNRHYHTLGHLSHMFDELRTATDAGLVVEDEAALRFAIWFHDYVYELNTDNELASAHAAYTEALEFGEAFADLVFDLILVTKHNHVKLPPMTNDQRVLCDLDLTSLAFPEDWFEENTNDIRKEYASVPDEIFWPKRKEILQMFLDRPSIYYTQYFRDLYEDKARKNLTNAISKINDMYKL